MDFKVDKEKLLDSKGKPLTQSLFLELGYNTEFAIYTLKSRDCMYKGKNYPSLKHLYLQHEDPLEFSFANEYLLDLEHWERICRNKQIAPYIERWRYELELKLRSDAIKSILDMSAEDKGFQAAKYIADKGWDRKAGRPSKKEQEIKDMVRDKGWDEYEKDSNRMLKVVD